MSYFELLAPSHNSPIELKALKDPKPLLNLLEAKQSKALSKSKTADNIWVIETKESAGLLHFLAQKQALTFLGKRLYSDPFNAVKISHTLSYDGHWHIHIDAQINDKKFPLQETAYHATGRWLIHKNFIHPLSEEVDRRSLEADIPIDEALCQKWRATPSDYPYCHELHIDETCELFEEEPSQNATLVWSDYAWSLAKIQSNAKDQESLLKDLLELGASSKTLTGGQVGVFWHNHEKLYEAMQILLEMGWSIQGPKQEKLYLLEPIKIESVTPKEGEIEIKASTRPKDPSLRHHVVSAGALSHYFKRAAKYIPLNEGTWLLLPAASSYKELSQGKSSGETLKLEPWRLQSLKSFSDEALDDRLKPWKHLSDLERQVNLTDFAFELRDYQKQGLAWLLNLTKVGIGGLLADEMGLGKTIQTLAFLYFLHQHDPKARYLIVAPRSLIQTWRYQIKKAFGDQICLSIHHGQERGSDSTSLDFSLFTLTTYQTLRQDLSLFTHPQKPWDVAIFDECHLWRNPQTQGYQALKEVAANIKIGLSGTPIYNSLDDLWHQLRLFAPQIVQKEPPQEAEALYQLRPLWLRRSKEEVAPELPDKIEETLWLEMDSEQEEIYQKLLHQSLKEENDQSTSPLKILEKILRLRQCCLWPQLVASSTQSLGVKAEQLLLDLETLLSESQSVLVFSQFIGVLSPMYNLSKDKYPCYYIDSHTQNREKVLESFEKSGPGVLFMTMGTGSVGLNLTKASAVILLDPWWNESVENQAIDRTHRIGQTKNVLVRRYMIQNSLEEAMDKLKNSKKSLTKAWENSESDSHFELELWQKLRNFDSR